MAVPTTNAVQAKKRKHPPTFQHLPRDRALKLKKLWVEKKKLKSRWKAQKRKEGLDSGWNRPRISPSQGSATEAPGLENDDGDHGIQEESSHDELSSENFSSDEDDAGESEHDEPAPKKTRSAQPDEQRRLSAKSKGKQPIRSTFESNGESPELEDGNPSLRELTRQAYSRESLHSFRADPLHRRKDAISSNQGHSRDGQRGGRGKGRDGDGSVRVSRGGRGPSRGRGAGGRSRGGRGGNALGRGARTSERHEARGQPNMKLRMEAMLERIKRDYS